MDNRISIVVINEYALCYLRPNARFAVAISTSIIRGATFAAPPTMQEYDITLNQYRIANKADFDTYRVLMEQYSIQEYNYIN